MNLIRLFISSSWKVMILAAIASVTSGITTTGVLAIISDAEVGYDTGIRTSHIWTFIVLCGLRFISNIISQALLISFSQEAIFNLRMIISQKILASPLYHLEKLGNYRLLAVLTDDIQSLSNTALILPRFCVNIVIVVSCLLYLYWLSPLLFLVILIFLVVGITSYQLIGNKANTNLSLAREQQDKLFNNFRAITDGKKDLMLHHDKRGAFFQDLQINAEAYKHQNVTGMSIFALASSWAQIMFFVAIGIVMFIIPNLNNHQNQLLPGYVLIITYMIVPLDSIMNSLSSFNKAFVALEKIKSLDLDLVNPISEIESPARLKLLTPAIENGTKSFLPRADSTLSEQGLELVNINYTYQNEAEQYHFTIQDINLKFYPGEIVFVIGGNGSGKSTFLKLLTGLYIPDDGRIVINEQIINSEEREWYRQHFSVVFTDFYLFENLLNLGKNISDEQIYGYLVKLQLQQKVTVKNGVLSTTELSQGQRKRLALLTAYLEDRPIYVFDEWAADQDPVFRNIFYTEILPDLKSKGKLVIAVTHDEQYYHLSDRIINLNNGTIEYDKIQSQPVYEKVSS